jgi:hypothetical protein
VLLSYRLLPSSFVGAAVETLCGRTMETALPESLDLAMGIRLQLKHPCGPFPPGSTTKPALAVTEDTAEVDVTEGTTEEETAQIADVISISP